MGTLDRSRDYATSVPGGAYAEQDGKKYRTSDGIQVDPVTNEVIEDEPEEKEKVEMVELQWIRATKNDIMAELAKLSVPYDPNKSKRYLWALYQDAYKGRGSDVE